MLRAAVSVGDKAGGGNLESLPFAFTPLLHPPSDTSCAPGSGAGVSWGQEQLEGFLSWMGICSFGACLQCLLFAHSPTHWKISRKTVPTPTSALRNPLRNCHGACVAMGPSKEGGVKPGHHFQSTSSGSICRLFPMEALQKFILLKLSSVA